MRVHDGEIFSTTKIGCLPWVGMVVVVSCSVGLALVIWGLWPDESAWGMAFVAIPFFVLAVMSLSRVVGGPLYVVRLAQGDLFIERRWFWWWTRRRVPLSKVSAIRLVELGEPSDGFTVPTFQFLDAGGKKLASIATQNLVNPKAFIKAIRVINPSIVLESRPKRPRKIPPPPKSPE